MYAEIWKLSVLLLVLLYALLNKSRRPVLTGKLESLPAQMLMPCRTAGSYIPDYNERKDCLNLGSLS